MKKTVATFQEMKDKNEKINEYSTIFDNTNIYDSRLLKFKFE